MRSIWRYGRTGGEYTEGVLNDALVSVPYTDQPPLERVRASGEPLITADQMFDLKLNQRAVLANALDHNNLNNPKVMYEALEREDDNLKQFNAKLMLSDVAVKQENTALKGKTDSLVQINSEIILASIQNSKDIAEIKEQLNPGGGE